MQTQDGPFCLSSCAYQEFSFFLKTLTLLSRIGSDDAIRRCLVALHPARITPRSSRPAARDPGVATSAPRRERTRPQRVRLTHPTECCGSGCHSLANGGQPSSSSSPRPCSPGIVEASGCSGLGRAGTSGSTRHASGRPCIDSPDVEGKSALGRAENPRRTLKTRRRRQSSDRGQIHGSPPAPAVPDLADIPHQSRRPDRGRRFLRRPHRRLSTAVRVIILAHRRRRVVHVAVTAHPTALWTAQQLREAFPEDAAPRYLIHDRDHAFAAFAMTASGMGIHELRTAPRSPWQNGYVERFIGSIRRECLDHVIVVNETGLSRVLTRYLAYYHRSRTHLSLAKDSPRPGRSLHQRWGRSWPFQRSAASTTATTAARRSDILLARRRSTDWSARSGDRGQTSQDPNGPTGNEQPAVCRVDRTAQFRPSNDQL